MPTDEVEKAVRRYKRPPGVEYDPRRGKEVYRPKDPAKVAKAEKLRLEAREDDKAFWDRVERVGEKVIDMLPRIGGSIASGALGYIAFTPTRFDIYNKAELSRREITEKKRTWYPGHGDAVVHKFCVHDCRGLSDVDRKKCEADCFGAYKGYWVETVAHVGYDIVMRIYMKVYANLHTLVPNLVVDIKAGVVDFPWPLPDIVTPGLYWSLREMLAFDLSRDFLIKNRVGGPSEIAVFEAAIAKVKAEITRTFQAAGAFGGFGGGLALPDIMKGLAELLKGVGEIVPG